MHLLYCDESNLEKTENDFFVYGGLVVEPEYAHALSAQIDSIRTAFKVPGDFKLKFNPGPDHLNHAQFIELKQQVVKAAIEHRCAFLATLILHNIATSPEDARRNEINRICYHFDCYLHRAKAHGLALIDRFEDKRIDNHLREKFSIGLKGLPYSQTYRMNRILGFHYSAIGQSHFCSITDVVVSSLRFAINTYTRNESQRLDSAKAILKLIAPLFVREGPNGRVSEISLFFSPKAVRLTAYRKKYSDLRLFLADQGIVAQQEFAE